MPTKTWAVGEEVLAADFNSYVQRQVVATFPNAAARNAAIAAPAAGMACYLADLQALQVHNGTGWRTYPGGQLGYSEVTADSGGVTGTPAPSALQVTGITIPGGRRIRVSASLQMAQVTGGASHIRTAIYQDGASILARATYTAGSVAYHSVQLERVVSPAAGTHGWQVYVWTDSGTATIASGTVPNAASSLTVEDIGV